MVKLFNLIKRYPQLSESFVSLSLLNGLNFLLPLISLPYLVRVVGPENYGRYSFILVILLYMNMVSNYGFSFSGTKLIAENRESKPTVSKYFSAIIFVRLTIAVILSLVLVGLIQIIPILHNERIAYLMGLGIVFGDVFIPNWFFQGMEKMRYMTIVNFILKGFFTIMIFFLIQVPEDYPKILLLNSFGYLSAGIASMLIVFTQFKIRMVIPRPDDLIFQLREGWHLFVSTISMNLYRNANIFILGLIAGDYIVGIYAAAEKLIKALQSLISPISQALFPYMSRRFIHQNKKKNLKDLFRISRYYFLVLFMLSILTFFGAIVIVKIVFGPEYIDSVSIIRIMSFVILFGGLNYLLGIIGLINLGEKVQFTRFVIIAGLVNITITIILAKFIFANGAAIGMLASEIVLFILIYVKLLKIWKDIRE